VGGSFRDANQELTIKGSLIKLASPASLAWIGMSGEPPEQTAGEPHGHSAGCSSRA